MIWSALSTAERISAVRAKHQPGYSAQQIASFFDGATRNAVIGMYHRYPDQFADKPLPTASRYLPRKPDKRLNGKPKMTHSKPLPPVPSKGPINVGRLLVRLNGGMCRWAVNEAEPGELHLFCGEATDAIYCEYHARRARGVGTEGERSAHRALVKELR